MGELLELQLIQLCIYNDMTYVFCLCVTEYFKHQALLFSFTMRNMRLVLQFHDTISLFVFILHCTLYKLNKVQLNKLTSRYQQNIYEMIWGPTYRKVRVWITWLTTTAASFPRRLKFSLSAHMTSIPSVQDRSTVSKPWNISIMTKC